MTRFNRMGQNPYTEFRILPLSALLDYVGHSNALKRNLVLPLL